MNGSTKELDIAPVHIVYGLKGSGKTTLLSHLISLRPENETWALLSNEKGKTHIDASKKIIVEDLSGECFCCTGGIAFKIALARILRKHRPNRIFIEAAGDTHAEKLAQAIPFNENSERLFLSTCFTVIDPQVFFAPQHVGHPIFNKQICASQIIVTHQASEILQTHIAEKHPQKTFLEFEKLQLHFKTPQQLDSAGSNTHPTLFSLKRLQNANHKTLLTNLVDSH